MQPMAHQRVQLREGKDVNFWYDYAQEMSRMYKDLVEDKDAFVKLAIERRANGVGLRAVIRYLLVELRKSQPNHPLLDKQNRDRVFHEFAQPEMDTVLKSNDLQPWSPLLRPNEHQSE